MADDESFITTRVREGRDRITLRFLADPGDLGPSGESVPAGRLLEWIDKAAYAVSVGWSGRYCVTAYVGDVKVSDRIQPGELVEVEARVVFTGRSSMHILVSVASSNPRSGSFVSAMKCLLVMVAVDEGGKPVEVPSLHLRTDADRILSERVRDRISLRAQIQESMAGARFTGAGTTPRTVLRFLASPSDVNWGGKVHGGRLMRWIDEAAFACAAGWAQADVTPWYSGGMQFKRPVQIGDLVEISARLIHVQNREMHLSIQVRSGRPSAPADLRLATVGLCIYVLDDLWTSSMPPLKLVSDEDRALDKHARELIELRAQMPTL